jgi:heme/copper-type cytochrome/quinol oxidase subunit 3
VSEIIYERPGLGDSPHDGQALINSSRFAFFLFLGVEIMLFSGLIGGYVILHGGSEQWPPIGAPDFSIPRLVVTSGALLAAALAIGIAGSRKSPIGPLKAGLALSMGFIGAVIADMVILSTHGLLATEVYGGIYYLLSLTFVLHAVGGLVAVANTYKKATALSLGENSLPHLSYYYYLLTLAWFAVSLLIHG